MRFSTVFIALTLLLSAAVAQEVAKSESKPNSVTVPITLDHNRVIIDVYVPLPDGATRRVRGWVDTGDPEFWVSPRVAEWMRLTEICNGQTCSATAPPGITSLQIMIGGMKIPLPQGINIKVPGLRPTSDKSILLPGTSAEIKIPPSLIRNYDVLINFPDREFSIGIPGTLKFKGVKSKMLVNANTGFIQIPSRIENKNYDLGLDVGSPISFLSQELFDKLASTHADWPHMTGAVGPANMGELLDDEPKWKLMRVDRVQYGPLFLTDVAVAEFPKDFGTFFQKDAGTLITGLIGSNALMNYRIGLDYAHSTVYFDIGSTFRFPDFDVVGLILRPEYDTRFTIIGVADFEGMPSIPSGNDGVQAGDHLAAVDGIPVPDSTQGQVWSLLEGTPGQERKLTIERAGKQLMVAAKVRHFLGDPEENQSKGKPGKKN